MWTPIEVDQNIGKDSQSSLFWKRKLQRRKKWSGERWHKFKRLPDQIMYGQKYGRKLVKPLRVEENWNGQKRSQSLTKLEDWGWVYIIDPDDMKNTKILSNMRGELERPMAPAMPCKRNAETGTTKVVAKHEVASQKITKNDLWLHGGTSWIHKATSGIFSTRKTRRSHCRQGFYFDDPLQFGSQVYS